MTRPFISVLISAALAASLPAADAAADDFDPYYGSGQFEEVIAAAGVPAQGTITVDEWTPIGPGESIVLEGQGNGHGRGMSQFGARGAAELGVDYRDILGFYYPGTELSTIDDSEIKVWLEADSDEDTIVLADGELTVVDGAGNGFEDPAEEAAERYYLAYAEDDGTMSVFSQDESGEWSQRYQGVSPVTFSSSPGMMQVIYPDGTRGEYRGAIEAALTGDGFKTINVLPMEEYLYSVVPKEMPVTFPAEALNAQAVAARTYSASERADHQDREWQICDSVQCQVYGGVRKLDEDGISLEEFEAESTTQAVQETANEILKAPDGTIAFAQFSSANGGWTTVGKGGQSYLPAQPDIWDCVDNYAYPWLAVITSEQLAAQWPEVGTPTAITITERNGNGAWGGRALAVRIGGSDGSVTVDGEDFRIALKLRSNWYRITDVTADEEYPATPLGQRWEHVGPGDFAVAPTAPWNLCYQPPALRDLLELWKQPTALAN